MIDLGGHQMVNSQELQAPGIVAMGLVGIVLAIGLATMPGQIYPGDPFAMREEARSLLRGQLSVDLAPVESFGMPGQFFVEHGGRYYSKYGLMNAIMSLPPLAIERVVTGSLPRASRQVRLLLLNLYNVFLSAVLAVSLYRLAGLFTHIDLARAGYVLAVFYGTFLWNYLRAQAGEIVQVLFFVGFYYRLNTFARYWLGGGDRPTSHPIAGLYLAWAWLAALILTRLSYLLLMPLPFALAAYAVARSRSDGAVRWVHPLHFLVPATGILLLVGAINYIKFGSPLLTGYHQWRPEWHRLTGSAIAGIRGFLLDPQRSIFIHFPVLLLALPGARRFVREYPLDACAIIGVAIAYLFVIGKLPSWRGENCYGPRYLLFVLPLLSLPFALVLETIIVQSRGAARVLWVLACSVVLIPSVWCQIQVNRLPFMTFYEIRLPLENDSGLDYVGNGYLKKNFSLINFDILRFLENGMPLPYIVELRRVWTADRVEAYNQHVLRIAKSRNYYW
jgi:hypothetical protein